MPIRYAQKRTDPAKVYSVHKTHTAGIAKGKAGRKYEFGQKASVAATSKGGWLVGAKCMPGNPYDGHTLKAQMEQVERVYIKKEHLSGYRLTRSNLPASNVQNIPDFIKKEDPNTRWACSGHKPGNNLLSRDLTSYYHQLLGA